MRTGGALRSKGGSLLDLRKGANKWSRGGIDDCGEDTDTAGGKCTWCNQRGVDGAIGINRRGLIGFPLEFFGASSATTGCSRFNGVTRDIRGEGWLAQGLIDRLSTGSVGCGGNRNATADGPNDGTHRIHGTEGGGLKHGGLIICLVQDGILFLFHNITSIHRV